MLCFGETKLLRRLLHTSTTQIALRCGCTSDDGVVHQPRWLCAKGLAACRLADSLAHRSRLQYCTQFATDDNPTTNTQVSRQHRQHAYLRRFLQRTKDLPGQGALKCRSTSRRSPPPPEGRHFAIATHQSEHLAEGDDDGIPQWIGHWLMAYTGQALHPW